MAEFQYCAQTKTDMVSRSTAAPKTSTAINYGLGQSNYGDKSCTSSKFEEMHNSSQIISAVCNSYFGTQRKMRINVSLIWKQELQLVSEVKPSSLFNVYCPQPTNRLQSFLNVIGGKKSLKFSLNNEHNEGSISKPHFFLMSLC